MLINQSLGYQIQRQHVPTNVDRVRLATISPKDAPLPTYISRHHIRRRGYQ
jgi:hypothetical protein